MSVTGWRTRGTLGAISLVVVGITIGLLFDHLFLQRHLAVLLHGTPVAASIDAAPELAHDVALASMAAYVGLDPEQTAAIDAIFAHHQQTVTVSWEELHWRLQEAIDSIESQIDAVLRPEQQQRFQRWVARHHPEGRAGVERALTADPGAAHPQDDLDGADPPRRHP